MSIATGLIYPLFVTGFAQVFFPAKANGSIVERNGHLVGSSLIGQEFGSPGYFWGRLSATIPFPYNASSSAGSNYGPLHPSVAKAAKVRVALLRSLDSANTQPIPVDLITASGSGLDPHISVASALYQAARVARKRKLPEAKVDALIEKYTDARALGVLGEPGVNVLELNLALDNLSNGSK